MGSVWQSFEAMQSSFSTNEQSKHWTQRGELALQTSKTVPSAVTVMAPVFWDRLSEEIRGKRSQSAKNKVFFREDVPAHTPVIAMVKISQSDSSFFRTRQDLTPSDYFLLPNLEKWLCGKRFTHDEQVESEVDTCFVTSTASYYKQGMEVIQYLWEECANLKGDYVDK
ncbi:uncharacterized protein [Euwallacea fornicatus]|uniref:uncharacterized protein n=1 Tax=Euwallacea fornicatus TaxID=995702 RepID=UPI00338D3E91